MRKRAVIAASALLLVLGAAGCGTSTTPAAQAAPAASSSTPPGITTQGTGQVSGSPDIMTLTIGVQTTGAHATEALASNASLVTAVIGALSSHGVAAADIQTSQLSLNPDYGSGTAIRGYDVTGTVVATVRNIGQAGPIIDAAVAAAGDAGRIDGVSFSFSDDSTLLSQARSMAVAAAKVQAQQLAAAAGVKLGTLQSLTEDVSQPNFEPFAASGAAASVAPTPVQSGSQQLTVQVSATWNLG